MNMKRFGLSVLAAFVFVFVFEMLFHGFLLKGLYESTAQVWRTEQEMMGYMGWATGSQLFFAVMFSWLFINYIKVESTGDGIRFGLFMGLLLGGVQFGFYPYMPIPFILAGAWFLGAVIEGTALGAILAMMNKPKSA